MSKERYTEEQVLDQFLNGFTWIAWSKENAIKAMKCFAAQEVEAAIAETKKQRDELLKAINSLLFMATGKGDPCGDLNWDTAEARAIKAITNAQEK
jgi:hypothetical protein